MMSISRRTGLALSSTLLLLLTTLPAPAQQPGDAPAPAPAGDAQEAKEPSRQEIAKGDLLIANEQWKEAVPYFAKLHERFPGHGWTLLMYAYSLHSSGQLEKALPLHRKLAKSENAERSRLGKYNTACALALLGKKEPAIYALYQAVKSGFRQLEHIKSDSDLASLRGDIRYQKLIFALEDGEELPAVQFRPSVRDAQALVRVKRFADAQKALETILERQPGQPMATYYLGYALHMQGKLDAALPYHVKASAFRGAIGYSSAYNAACVHAQKGRIDAAFEWLDKSVAKGFKDKANLAGDSDLKALHEDPRWAKLLKRLD